MKRPVIATIIPCGRGRKSSNRNRYSKRNLSNLEREFNVLNIYK